MKEIWRILVIPLAISVTTALVTGYIPMPKSPINMKFLDISGKLAAEITCPSSIKMQIETVSTETGFSQHLYFPAEK